MTTLAQFAETNNDIHQPFAFMGNQPFGKNETGLSEEFLKKSWVVASNRGGHHPQSLHPDLTYKDAPFFFADKAAAEALWVKYSELYQKKT